MFSTLTNLVKATVSVALTPAAVAVDVVTLPITSSNGEEPFEVTSALLKNAGECVSQAVKPTND
jgi:hypothetical protein